MAATFVQCLASNISIFPNTHEIEDHCCFMVSRRRGDAGGIGLRMHRRRWRPDGCIWMVSDSQWQLVSTFPPSISASGLPNVTLFHVDIPHWDHARIWRGVALLESSWKHLGGLAIVGVSTSHHASLRNSIYLNYKKNHHKNITKTSTYGLIYNESEQVSLLFCRVHASSWFTARHPDFLR